jgi:hypothetical protein
MENNKIENPITEINRNYTYHLSQAKANKKYYDTHKDEIYQKLKEKMQNDPEFKQKRLEYARRTREKKKLLKLQQQKSAEISSESQSDSSKE